MIIIRAIANRIILDKSLMSKVTQITSIKDCRGL